MSVDTELAKNSGSGERQRWPRAIVAGMACWVWAQGLRAGWASAWRFMMSLHQ